MEFVDQPMLVGAYFRMTMVCSETKIFATKHFVSGCCNSTGSKAVSFTIAEAAASVTGCRPLTTNYNHCSSQSDFVGD